MKRIDEMFGKFMFKVNCFAQKVLTDEKGEVNIVTIVVLIGIAVLLAITFRKQISKLLTDLFSTITKNATDAVNDTAGT